MWDAGKGAQRSRVGVGFCSHFKGAGARPFGAPGFAELVSETRLLDARSWREGGAGRTRETCRRLSPSWGRTLPAPSPLLGLSLLLGVRTFGLNEKR